MSGKDMDSLEQLEAEMQAEIEAEKRPVRTVTRKEVVPGKYGHVLVDRAANGGALVVLGFKSTGGIFPEVRSLFSADELRAAAATFIELADAIASDQPPSTVTNDAPALRDQFAEHALTAIISNASAVFPRGEFTPWARHAEEAYKVADAMLAERSKP